MALRVPVEQLKNRRDLSGNSALLDSSVDAMPRGAGARLLAASAIALLAVAYAASRLWALSALPIFFDEAHYTLSALLIGRHPLRTDPFVEVAYWGVPPLFTWVAAPVARFGADPLLSCRLVSGLLGAVGLVGVWRCGREVGGRRVALPAAAFYVLCPFFLLYHRMAMVDGLLATIGAFALLAAMRLARDPSPRAAATLGGLLAAASLTKIIGPLLLALPLCAVIAAPPDIRRRVARWAVVAATVDLAAVAALLSAPGGASLIAVMGQQQRLSAPFLVQTAAQATIIAQSYWLYATPPVLLLALLGARQTWRTPETRLLVLWAGCSAAPFALMHLNLSSRYLLYGAVPLILLAARGVARLTAPGARRTSRRLAAIVLLVAVGGVCAWEDIPLVADPAHAAMVPGDWRQYIAGWPAGYALVEALADVRRAAHGRQVTLVSSTRNPPGDALAVLLSGDHRVHLAYADFRDLARPGALDRYGPATFVIVCRPTGQPLDARRAGLRLVAVARDKDGAGGVYVYTPGGAGVRGGPTY